MAEESTYRLIFLLAGLVVLQTSPAARTQQPNQLGMRFPMIQIVTGETARVNAQNLEAGSSAKDSSCSVTLQFLDTGAEWSSRRSFSCDRGRSRPTVISDGSKLNC
jgi:hypothetical protein